MGPLSIFNNFPEWANLLTGFIIGIGFGFALEQAGFSSSRKLAGMFYGYDATVKSTVAGGVPYKLRKNEDKKLEVPVTEL